jgi:hypothetical protein
MSLRVGLHALMLCDMCVCLRARLLLLVYVWCDAPFCLSNNMR